MWVRAPACQPRELNSPTRTLPRSYLGRACGCHAPRITASHSSRSLARTFQLPTALCGQFSGFCSSLLAAPASTPKLRGTQQLCSFFVCSFTCCSFSSLYLTLSDPWEATSNSDSALIFMTPLSTLPEHRRISAGRSSHQSVTLDCVPDSAPLHGNFDIQHGPSPR